MISPLPHNSWAPDLAPESCNALITWLGDHKTNEKRYISTYVKLMATKLNRAVASDEIHLSVIFQPWKKTYTSHVLGLIYFRIQH